MRRFPSYRRRAGWPAGQRRSLFSRLADPLVYLRAVIGFSLLALLALPFGADAVNAIARPAIGPAGACRILSVIDGDTVTLWCDGQGIDRARLVGFDAPELYSPGCASELIAAQKATWALRWMVFQADGLRIRPAGRDRYDRALVELWLGGLPVAEKMIADGHARAYAGGRRAGWCAA